MSAHNIEQKANQRLSAIRGQMLSAIIGRAQNRFEYHSTNLEELVGFVEALSNPALWDKHGILDAADKRELELLEFLLNDNAEEIRVYKPWKPMKS